MKQMNKVQAKQTLPQLQEEMQNFTSRMNGRTSFLQALNSWWFHSQVFCIQQPENPHRPQEAPVPVKGKITVHIVGDLDTANLVVRELHVILLQSSSQSSQHTTQSSAQPQSYNPQSYNPPIPLSSQASTLYVPPSTTDTVTSWELPVSLSQSTIGGRHGSNACTVTSLLLAKTYLTNKQLLQFFFF